MAQREQMLQQLDKQIADSEKLCHSLKDTRKLLVGELLTERAMHITEPDRNGSISIMQHCTEYQPALGDEFIHCGWLYRILGFEPRSIHAVMTTYVAYQVEKA